MSIDNVIFSSTFSSDGGVYVCGDRGGNLHVANVLAGQSNFKTMSTECGTIYSLAFVAGSNTVAWYVALRCWYLYSYPNSN